MFFFYLKINITS